LIIFCFLYVCRLLWDWLIVENLGIPGPDHALLIFVGTVFGPAVASSSYDYANENESDLAWKIAISAASVGFLAFLMNRLGWGTDRFLSQAMGRIFYESLNPITVGHAGVTALLACLSLTTKLSYTKILALPLMVAPSIWCVIQSGSRGPVLALLIPVLAYVLVKRKFFWVAVLAICSVPFALDESNILYKRFSWGIEASANARLYMQAEALTQFSESPIFGEGYCERLTMSYPHNLAVETLMALGGVGFCVLLVILYGASKNTIICIRKEKVLIPLLTLQYCVGGMFSGAIWGAGALFCCLFVLSQIQNPKS
jgi:O-antigen ligase